MSKDIVLKNPASRYHDGERTDDWVKLKPDYIIKIGEDLDCLILEFYTGRLKAVASF